MLVSAGVLRKVEEGNERGVENGKKWEEQRGNRTGRRK